MVMNTAELVFSVAENANVTKKVAAAVVKSITGAIHDSLKRHGEIRIAGLGTFRVLAMKARNGVNPRTLGKMKIPAMKLPRFSAAKSLKDAVKGVETKSGKKNK
jgi:DNA-binding protein HU-beta